MIASLRRTPALALLSPALRHHDFSRRDFLAGCAAAALAMGTGHARAEGGNPGRPIQVIVPFGPGGLADISMRLVAQKLSERMGQPWVVDNRPGAGGVVAATSALSAPRDGHTLILFSNGTAIGKSLFKLGYDPEVDFTPISSLALFDLVLITRKDGPLTDLPKLLAAGRARPLLLGSINPGSTQNLSAELFKSVAGLNHADVVPHKSTPQVLISVLRGDVDVAFESYAALKGAVDSGQVRAVATTGSARTAWLPDVPTVQEAGLADYVVTGWNALYATAGTPADRVEQINGHMQAVMTMPEVRQRLLDLGTEARASTSAQQAEVFRRDTAKWAQVIARANIKVS
ncbi:Bug family tripartite tricarboxylate transporter substrate binding protein [Hylemonella gracilis]|jgi:tripartite-type tricarboxylate transporter receptor subunit TctC|nr:tripartite tricarboxylate transporter substrate-binding protein [Hylemonella gracilis]